MQNLSRVTKGQPISHEVFNKLVDAIKAIGSIDVDTSSGLQIARTPNGWTIGLVPQRVASYAIVSSEGIGAASGTTLGKGSIDLQYKDDNGVLQPYNGPSDDCYNSTTATAAKGDIIQVKWIDGDWAWDVASCP